MSSGVYWNRFVCPSFSVSLCSSVCPSVYNILVLSKCWWGYGVTFSDHSSCLYLRKKLLRDIKILMQIEAVANSRKATGTRLLQFISPHRSVGRAFDLKTRGCGFYSRAGQPNNY